MKKFKVYMNQTVYCQEVIIEADTDEEAIQIYNDRWNDGMIPEVKSQEETFADEVEDQPDDE